uniref:Uncharacterized protein AlNc14C106G6211 n=1 Tax=Albugo laibachii Nc14 TaxID=890382 RepID=F0WI04_9STRA|nr:unknown putative [Albugo laibachii Nc14]|eukprot:CCA20881.1 unknown putative [Albugo laibachii Nc14]
MLFGKELREAYQALSILQRELREEKEKNSQLQQHITAIQARDSAMTAPGGSLESDSDSDVIETASNVSNTKTASSDIQHVHKHEKKAYGSPYRHSKHLDDSFDSNQNDHLYSDSELQELEFLHLKSDPNLIASEELMAQCHQMKQQLHREKECNAEKINEMQQQLLQSEFRVLQSQQEQAELKQVCAQLLEQLNASKHSNVMQLSDLESHAKRWEQNALSREQELIWQHRIQLTQYKQVNTKLSRGNSAYKRIIEQLLCKVEDREGKLMQILQTLLECKQENANLEDNLKQNRRKEEILTQNWRKMELETSKWKERVISLEEEREKLAKSRKHVQEKERNQMVFEDLRQKILLSEQQKCVSVSESKTLRKEVYTLSEKCAVMEKRYASETKSMENEERLTGTIKQLQGQSHRVEKHLSRVSSEHEKLTNEMTLLKRENSQLRNALYDANEKCESFQREQKDICQKWNIETRTLQEDLELVLDEKNDLLVEEESLRTQWIEATESLEKLSVEHIDAISIMEVRTESLERQLLSSQENPISEICKESDPMHTIQQFSLRIPLLQTLFKDAKAVIRLFQSHKHLIRTLCDHAIQINDVDTRSIWPLLKWSHAIVKASEPYLIELSRGKRPLAYLKDILLRLVNQWHPHNVYQMDYEEELPPVPPFTIKSQECMMILQNWTTDRKKQARVHRWLNKVSTESLEEFGRNPNSMLLDNMTQEVKDAFCMLLIPILRQNTRLRLCVYTRQKRVEREHQSDWNKLVDGLVWDMKIGISWNESLRWNDSDTIECEAENSALLSPCNSTHSSTLSTSSSSSFPSGVMLGIIEARLKQLQS